MVDLLIEGFLLAGLTAFAFVYLQQRSILADDVDIQVAKQQFALKKCMRELQRKSGSQRGLLKKHKGVAQRLSFFSARRRCMQELLQQKAGHLKTHERGTESVGCHKKHHRVYSSLSRTQIIQLNPALWMGLPLDQNPMMGEFVRKRAAVGWKNQRLTLVKRIRKRIRSNDMDVDYVLVRCRSSKVRSSKREGYRLVDRIRGSASKEIHLLSVDIRTLCQINSSREWQFSEMSGRVHTFMSDTPEMAQEWCEYIREAVELNSPPVQIPQAVLHSSAP